MQDRMRIEELDHLKIELEWRVPWPGTWPIEKKRNAANRLVSYVTSGTFFETSRRMMATARVVDGQGGSDPWIEITLES